MPQCNFASFQAKQPFVNPIDGKNLNDTFPGSADGTMTERLCHILVHEFAAKAQYHIDMHSGDSIEWLHPYAFYHINEQDPAVTEIARPWAKCYGLNYVSYTETAGAGATDKGNFYAAVSELGIPSIQPEIGGIGLIECKTKLLHYNGARNVLIIWACCQASRQKTAASRSFPVSIGSNPILTASITALSDRETA